MNPNPHSSPQSMPSLRQTTHVIYALFAAGILGVGVFGIAVIAAVVLAYVKRSDAAGTIYAAHFDWVLATFWWGVLWLALSALAVFVFVGWITGVVALVWVIWRLIKGWLALAGGRSPGSD